MVPSSDTMEADWFKVSFLPEPVVPIASMKYSASMMTLPAAESSPVVDTATSDFALVSAGVKEPFVVCGPVLGRLNTTDPMTPQLPALSRPRT